MREQTPTVGAIQNKRPTLPLTTIVDGRFEHELSEGMVVRIGKRR